MNRPPRLDRRTQQWLALCDEIDELALKLRYEGPPLLARAAIPVVDGYPRLASGAAHERGRIARLPSDEDDPDDDGRSEGVARPVENLVLAGPPADPVADHAHDMRAHLLEALRSLRRANDARARAIYVPVDERPTPTPVATGCVVCARYEIYSVAVKAGRCWADYQYKRRNGRDAPRDKVLGRQATPRQLAELHRDEDTA